MNIIQIGKYIFILGTILLVVGGGLFLIGKLGIPVGRLPGDIRIERENFSFYFPLTTMVLVSIVLTLGFNLLSRWLNK